MAYELHEGSFKVSNRPAGGYALSFPTVKSNKLALKNEFTRDRDSGKRQPPLTPDRLRRGKRGGAVSSSAALRSVPRQIV